MRADDDDPAIVVWKAHAQRFLATGVWPSSMGTEQQRRWWADAQVLERLGEVLADVPIPAVRVHIPNGLADEAAAAWARDDDGEPPGYETAVQRVNRRRAADLALIGLAIETQGTRDGEAVAIDLPADLIVAAIRAAEN